MSKLSISLLTPCQKDIFRFIQQWIVTEGTSPSLQNIKEGLGYNSISAIYVHLEALEARGLITSKKTPGGNRIAHTILPVGAACPTCGRPLA